MSQQDILGGLERILSVTATAVWLAMMIANLLNLRGSVLGLSVTLPSLQVEEIGRYLLSVTYRILIYVLAFVTIVSGIQAALGFVSKFITTFIPITIPSGSLHSMIRTVLGLYLIKIIVDAMLRYWGFPMAAIDMETLLADAGSWTFISCALLGAVVGAILTRRALIRWREEVVEFR